MHPVETETCLTALQSLHVIYLQEWGNEQPVAYNARGDLGYTFVQSDFGQIVLGVDRMTIEQDSRF